jgi:adenylate cyclase class 2
MLEIEVKAPADDLARVAEMLRRMGASGPKVEHQIDAYYAHPSRDFGSTDEALRLRRTDDGAVLTYKGPKVDKDTKTREEIETPVPDPDAVAQILQRVGFTTVIEVRKERHEYILEDTVVALDRVHGLGDFVEVEYRSQDIERGRRRVGQVLRALDLEGNERRSYLELLMMKR